jgi:hypothetical protein
MPSSRIRSRIYRKRAEEARTLADVYINDAHLRANYLTLAQSYDLLAADAEQVETRTERQPSHAA